MTGNGIVTDVAVKVLWRTQEIENSMSMECLVVKIRNVG
jgi:hypothetical protein